MLGWKYDHLGYPSKGELHNVAAGRSIADIATVVAKKRPILVLEHTFAAAASQYN